MNEQFAKVKKVEMEILQEFTKVCDALHLRWYAGYGTTLGAIRHKGFIPWDDDIDVLMPRKDYEIFCEKAQEMVGANYFVQTMDTEEEYYQPFAKLRRSDTTFWEIGTADDHINHGIYIDIFPMDGYPSGIAEKIFMMKRIVYDNFIYDNGDINKLSGYRKWIAKGYRLVKGTLSKKEAARKKENMVKAVPYDGTAIVGCLVQDTPKGESVPVAVYGDGEVVPFEEMSIRVPSECDIYLKKLYGDYMQFPPEDKRVPIHTCHIIDADKSYLEYEEELNGKKNIK